MSCLANGPRTTLSSICLFWQSSRYRKISSNAEKSLSVNLIFSASKNRLAQGRSSLWRERCVPLKNGFLERVGNDSEGFLTWNGAVLVGKKSQFCYFRILLSASFPIVQATWHGTLYARQFCKGTGCPWVWVENKSLSPVSPSTG